MKSSLLRFELADRGFPVTEWIALHFATTSSLLRANEAAARTFLISGRPPRVGEIFRNPDLAWSLRQIAQGGRDAFYHGEITARLLALSAQKKAHSSRRISPITQASGSNRSQRSTTAGQSTSCRPTGKALARS